MNRTEHPTELSPGTILHDNYEIGETVKSGGMGRIYKAKQIHFEKVYAIKQTFFAEPSQRQWFLNEAITLRSLNHERLPKVVDYFCLGNNCYLIMEFIEGRDLMDILDEEGTIHPGSLIPWAIQLLKILSYLHSKESSRQPVIHRDIKPQNIKLDAEGNIFLLDFGLAKSGTQTLVPGAGTPAYSSPEQMRCLGTDIRSDLFSLGAALYHLSTGEVPKNAYERQSAIQQKQPDPIKRVDSLRPEITPGLATIIEKAMALEPSDRFNSATDMLNAIQGETAEAYVQHGARYVEQGEYDGALEALCRAILLYDKVADVYSWRARAYAAKGQTDLAIVDFGKELEQNPGHFGAYLHRGNLYFEQGNFGLAIADFNTALELDPTNADLYFRRGMAYRGIGNAERAVLEFRRALELSSVDSDIHRESSKELQSLKPTTQIDKSRPDSGSSEAHSKHKNSLSIGAIQLLVWSVNGIVIWIILSLTLFTPQSVETARLHKVFAAGVVLVTVVAILWSLAKPKVLLGLAIIMQLTGVILLTSQWIFSANRASEIAESEYQSTQLALQLRQEADRLNDGLVTDEARRSGKVVWQVGVVQNRTTQAITYYVFNEDKTWQQRTLQPNQSELLWKKDIAITIKFNSGTQEKQYNLDASPVVDREPDDPAKSKAPVNYFLNTSEGQVELYSTRPGRKL